MITSAVLTDPSRGISMVLNPRPGVLAMHGLEVAPSVREAVEDRADQDGSLDTSAYFSEAVVTVNLTVLPRNPGVRDQLMSFFPVWARPYLVVTDTNWSTVRQIQLRTDPWQHPIEVRGGAPQDLLEIQLAFKAPRGLWEDTNIQMYSILADIIDTNGMVFTDVNGTVVTDVAGYVFPPSSTSGSTLVNVLGNARPAWRARLYGPAVGPQLSNDTNGQSMVFTDGLVLQPGQFVELNTGPGPLAKTANLNGDPTNPALNLVDFTQSQWFPLDPGQNKIRYHPDSGTNAGTLCELTIYPVWMP